MIKVAHVSDLHYCEKHLEWVDRATGAAIDEAIRWGADLAVFSGDSFDSAITLHHPAVGKLIDRICAVAGHMPVFLLQGTFSHDRPGCLDVFKTLRTKNPVYVADQRQQVALILGEWRPDVNLMATVIKDATVVISAFPSLNRAEIQAVDPEQGTASYVDEWMQSVAPVNLHLRSLGVPTILVSHGTVNGCVTESKQAMVSQDHEFSAGSLFSAETSAVMLGHIHAFQVWEYADGVVAGGYLSRPHGLRARRIAYPGSITRLIHGHDSPVGMIKWEVGADAADLSLFETPSRRLIDIEFDGPPDAAVLATKLAACAGGFVRLRYSVDEEYRKGIDSDGIKQLLENAGLAGFKVEPRVNPIQRTRSSGISTETSTAERLKRWCALTDSDSAPLLVRLNILETSS